MIPDAIAYTPSATIYKSKTGKNLMNKTIISSSSVKNLINWC